jgi:lipopolysaccharide export system protein LptA
MNPVKTRLPGCILTACLLLAAGHGHGLPEDADQEIFVDADSSEVYLNDGRVIYRGLPDNPAVITQGSLKIMGLEIIIERLNGEIRRISASGEPSHFQQQPAEDQGIVYANGRSIIFDNENQLLTVREGARFAQDGNTLSGHFIEYNLASRVARAESRDSEDRVNMQLVPRRD